MHGGVARKDLGQEDVGAVRRGSVNLARHVENMRKFGMPVIVALNRFTGDTEAEYAEVRAGVPDVEVILCSHWADGSAGAEDLARAVVRVIDRGLRPCWPLYPDAMSLTDKLRTVAREIYRADDISLPPAVVRRLAALEADGFGSLPVCIAKTQYSFTTDPSVMGAPLGHVLPVREVRLSAGAGFVVAICGDIMTMPGLPRRPAAEGIGLDPAGHVAGLF